MSRVALLVFCVVAAGCDSGPPATTDSGSTGPSGEPSTLSGTLSTSHDPTHDPSGPTESTATTETSGISETSGEATVAGTTGDTTTPTGSTTTGSGSTSDSGTDTSGGPDPIVPTSALADIEWITPFAGLDHTKTQIRLWNGSPALVLNTTADLGLVVGEDTPAQTTVETSASSIVALVVFEGATGAVASTQVLYESTTPDMVEPFTSTLLADVAVDDSGALNVVGGWTGVTTFFPDTPDSTTRSTVAVSYIGPDGFLISYNRFDSAVLRIEPDGSAGWMAFSAPPDDSISSPSNYPWGVALFPNGDPLVSGPWLTPGTSFPAGSPDAYVSEGNESFFVRLDHATGGPAWIGLGDTGVHQSKSDSADGAIYIVLEGANGSDGMYFEDTPHAVTLPSGHNITRLDPDGGLAWAVFQTHHEYGGVSGVVALGDQGVAALGYSGGGAVTLEGADGVLVSTNVADVFTPRAQWFARLSTDGSVAALQPLPEALRVGHLVEYADPTAMLADDEGVWYGGYVHDVAWFDGADIPELSQLTDVPAALIHIDHDGFVDETRVLGQGFDLDTMAWADDTQTRMLVAARHRFDGAQGLLAPGEPQLEPLPLSLPEAGASQRPGFVASIYLGE